jgi:putative toxin-antitoxin system antitoxin component (TIGR02293 family)
MAESKSTNVASFSPKELAILARVEARHLKLAVDLLGGPHVLNVTAPPTSEEDADGLAARGIPAEALVSLFKTFNGLKFDDKLAAVGMNRRSFARRKAAPKTLLPLDESERVWRFAKLLGHALSMFKSTESVERWMTGSALGLARRRPIDVLTTDPGARLVDDYLWRIEFGVYT